MSIWRSMKTNILLTAVIVASAGSAASAQSRDSGDAPAKPIFDATRSINGSRAGQGERVAIPGSHRVRFVDGFRLHFGRNVYWVSRNAIRQSVQEWANEPAALTVIDIEHIPVENVRRGRGKSDRQVQVGQDVLSHVVDSIREEAPGLRIGFFDLLPPQHMYAWKEGNRNNEVWKRSFERAFYRIDPNTGERTEYGFVDRLDFLAPAVYLNDGRVKRYLKDKQAGKPLERNVGARLIREWIRDTVAAARTANKPVYPVVWHRMHGGRNPDSRGFETREYIGDELLRIVLEATLEYADGVILWSDTEQYDAEDPWHAVIAEFVQQPVATTSFDENGFEQDDDGNNRDDGSGASNAVSSTPPANRKKGSRP